MELAFPPSYDEAIKQEPGELIAPYLDSESLCQTVLVSQRWNEALMPFLWGNPASHFGTENDRVYVALTRFKRTLPRVRKSVRLLTHTLHLPPAQPELYDGPRAEWLREVMDHLPNLQSLIVSGLPFFDHASLMALHAGITFSGNVAMVADRLYSLRLLIASNCHNTTASSLSRSLSLWPDLVYLDLSDTLAARDHQILCRLSNMNLLQVLKLRHIQLRDQDLKVLAASIGHRVRDLDVRENHLSDASISVLLKECIYSKEDIRLHLHTPQASGFRGDSQAVIARPAVEVLDDLRSEDFDRRLLQRLTREVVHSLPSEDLPYMGITHLYIADNQISVEGAARLVCSENLHVLDIGSLVPSDTLGKPRIRSSAISQLDYLGIKPGAEKLTLDLEEHGRQNLVSLRINHAVVSKSVILSIQNGKPSELHDEQVGVSELESNEARIFELNGIPPTYELSEVHPVPRYELPGDPLRIVISPAVGRAPQLQPDTPKSGAVFAPEVLEQTDQEAISLTATGFPNVVQCTNNNQISPSNDRDSNSARHINLSLIDHHRSHLRTRLQGVPQSLVPGQLPKLATIILTDVPRIDNTGQILQGLKDFITLCASESRLAKVQAGLELANVPECPQGGRLIRAKEIFSLSKIVLEMEAPCLAARNQLQKLNKSTGTTWTKEVVGGGLSSTEDSDSDALWSAAANDFSFFGEEECGLPESEERLGRYSPYPVEKIVVTAGDMDSNEAHVLRASSVSPIRQESIQTEGKHLDVIAELAKWRRERKMAWEIRGPVVSVLDALGHWEGEIKVIQGTRNK